MSGFIVLRILRNVFNVQACKPIETYNVLSDILASVAGVFPFRVGNIHSSGRERAVFSDNTSDLVPIGQSRLRNIAVHCADENCC